MGDSTSQTPAKTPSKTGRGKRVLSVEDLRVEFKGEDGYTTAVDGLNYTLHEGETLGIVGESGSGKSVTNLAVMGLLPKGVARIPSGKILFGDQDLLKLKKREMRKIRGNKISMIFQDPMSSLNPFMRISDQLVEVLRLHQPKLNKKQCAERAIEMLAKVGIPDPAARFRNYPHQFSGGMRQRVMIAMMLLNTPELLIADEPTTALDVTIQAQILDLLRGLQDEFNMAITLITHDLGVVAGMADHMLVMYSGQTMESAPVDALFKTPAHPYTLGLMRSLPRVDARTAHSLYSIPGRPPDPSNRPLGCPFAPRCAMADAHCHSHRPPVQNVGPDHFSACFKTDQVAELVASGRHLETPEAHR